MKRVLMILVILSTTLMAKDDYKINLAIGLFTHHVDNTTYVDDYSYNEKNDLIILEYEKNNKSIMFGVFENSFFEDSFMLMGGYKFEKKGFYLSLRAGVCKGYNAVDVLYSNANPEYSYEFKNFNVIYKDWSVIGTIGVGYTYKKMSLEVDVFGTAIVGVAKIQLN